MVSECHGLPFAVGGHSGVVGVWGVVPALVGPGVWSGPRLPASRCRSAVGCLYGPYFPLPSGSEFLDAYDARPQAFLHSRHLRLPSGLTYRFAPLSG